MQHWGWNQGDFYHNAGLRLSEHAGPFSPSPGYVGAAASEGWHYPLPIGQRISASRLGAYGRRFAEGGPLVGFALNAAFGGAMAVGTAMTESARWGAKTGFQEDYVGGWVHGWEKGKSKAYGMIGGDLAGMALGSLVPIPGATMIGGMIGSLIGDPIAEFFTRRGDYEKGRRASFNAAGAMAKRKVQFGRGFRDTEEAYTMRQMAVQEMAGSLLNARQYLGNEAFFLHR
jgi:hypothetical protein